MNVTIFAKMACSCSVTTEDMLNTVASQSRHAEPKNVGGLFTRTVKDAHESIQEFADYTFHIEGISRACLLQLTRHRLASYNVFSGRTGLPLAPVLPGGVTSMGGSIDISNKTAKYPKGTVSWWVGNDGEFRMKCYGHYENSITEECTLEDLGAKLEDIRYGYPNGTTVNLFFKMNGRSLRNFFKLRLEKHAQWEIRRLAAMIYDLVEADCPPLVAGFEALRKAAMEESRTG